MIRFLAFCILTLSFVSCSSDKPERKKKVEFDYSAAYRKNSSACFIKSRAFSSEQDALNYARSLEKTLGSKIFIMRDSVSNPRSFTLMFGPFSSSLEAGESAYRLYSDKVINRYSIVQNNREINDPFIQTVFVGTSEGVSALLSYDLKDKSIKKVWSRPGEEIVDFSYSGDRSSAFIVTVSGYGKEGVFPFVKDVKLYRMDVQSGRTGRIKSYGNGIQIYSIRETSDSYRIIFISFDQRVSTWVTEHNIVYSNSGKVLSNKKRVFDLVKENFPPQPYLLPDFTSPGGKFALDVKNGDDSSSVLLKNVRTGKNFEPFKLKGQRISQLAWSDDGSFLVISAISINAENKTLRSEKPETSNLVVYSLKERKILNKWTGGGYKNFLLKGNFLFFDDGFGTRSKIYIYDLRSGKIIDTLRSGNGCGIRNIPFIPDYSA